MAGSRTLPEVPRGEEDRLHLLFDAGFLGAGLASGDAERLLSLCFRVPSVSLVFMLTPVVGWALDFGLHRTMGEEWGPALVRGGVDALSGALLAGLLSLLLI